MITWWRRRRAVADVVLSAKIVTSGYEQGLVHEYDPDELNDLRKAVERLRLLENPKVWT